MNSVAMNIGVHIFFLNCSFVGYMPRSGVAESYGDSAYLKLLDFLNTVQYNYFQFSSVTQSCPTL